MCRVGSYVPSSTMFRLSAYVDMWQGITYSYVETRLILKCTTVAHIVGSFIICQPWVAGIDALFTSCLTSDPCCITQSRHARSEGISELGLDIDRKYYCSSFLHPLAVYRTVGYFRMVYTHTHAHTYTTEIVYNIDLRQYKLHNIIVDYITISSVWTRQSGERLKM